MQDVSFELGRGQLLALIGPNGAGKSTCFNMLNGQLRPDTGSIALEGVDITGRPPREVWKARRGPHVPDHRHLRFDDRARKRANGIAIACAAAVQCLAACVESLPR